VGRPLHQLAQVNVARLLEPLDSPRLADFVAALDPINALADASPGFVWRLQTEDGDATSIRAFDDDLIIVNMSVWETLESLGDFVYRSAHTSVMRSRREWFEHMKKAYSALWWVRAGEIPMVSDAVARLEHLRSHGAPSHAFTFRRPFSARDAAVEPPLGNAWLCPA
jgi:uncharacterized protein DUF3291